MNKTNETKKQTFKTGESPIESLDIELIVAGTPENSLGFAMKILSSPISNPVVTICSGLYSVLSLTGQSGGKSYESRSHCFTISSGEPPRQLVKIINDIKVVSLMSSRASIFCNEKKKKQSCRFIIATQKIKISLW